MKSLAPITNRYDGTVFITVQMSNPNGDPDMDGKPRQDPLTGFGYMTPSCIKRKIRDYVQAVYGEDLWVSAKADLGKKTEEVAQRIRLSAKEGANSKSLDNDNEAQLVRAMGAAFFDVRAFGGVLANFNTRVTGPVQIGFGQSLEPVNIIEVPITNLAVANKEKQNADKTMGRMHVVSWAIYRLDFSISPTQAKRTGFTEADLRIFLEGVLRGFEMNPSTTRANVCVARIELFKHETEHGRTSKLDLIRAVKCEPRPATLCSKVDDYTFSVDTENLEGVTHYTFQNLKDLDAVIPPLPPKEAVA